MNYDVKEYWIVYPMLSAISVYTLNDEGLYEQRDINTETGEVSSKSLKGFGDVLTDV